MYVCMYVCMYGQWVCLVQVSCILSFGFWNTKDDPNALATQYVTNVNTRRIGAHTASLQ